MEIAFWIWIAVIVLSVIIEVVTLELVSVWFAIGAIIPAILSATNACGWELQLTIFIVLTAVFIVGLRKITLKYLFKNTDSRTNKDSLIGIETRMLEETNKDSLGSVKINGVTWSTKAKGNITIEKGTEVKIVEIAGNKLIVVPTKESSKETTKSKTDSKDTESKEKTKEDKGDK